MFNMRTMRIWSAAAVIALILAFGFILSVPRAHDVGGGTAVAPETQATPIVAIHNSYKKGLHALKVSVPAPDACTNVSGTTSVLAAATSTPDTIVIALSMPTDEGTCLKEAATTTLTFSVAASANAAIVATINGTHASTTSY